MLLSKIEEYVTTTHPSSSSVFLLFVCVVGKKCDDLPLPALSLPRQDQQTPYCQRTDYDNNLPTGLMIALGLSAAPVGGQSDGNGGSSHRIVGGVPEHLLWVVLNILNSLFCLLVVVQLLRIIIYRHNVVSFQGGFLSLSFLWSALRLLFWFSNTIDWPEWYNFVLLVARLAAVCYVCRPGRLLPEGR